MLSGKKVLYATDFSAAARHALQYATALAREAGATLLIAHVSTVEEYPVGELFDEEAEPFPPEFEQLKAVRPSDESVPCEHRLLYGDPAAAIVKLAADEHAETIVMGTHGYTGLTRLLAGSVAERVIREAPCSVVAIKLPQEEPSHVA